MDFLGDQTGIFFCFRRRCVFQPGSKIVDLGFVKFKSNGIKATLRTNPENTGSKKKAIFFVLLGGFAWIFSEIKQG